MRTLLTAIVGLTVAVAACARPPEGGRYAFLVACQDYDEKELRPLTYPRADIEGFRAALIASGYTDRNVIMLHDKQTNRRYLPEANKIREELKLLLAGLDATDTVIVAFAGHGVQFQGDGKQYYCPVDAKLGERTTLIAIDEVMSALDHCSASRRLLLVDACRNDPQSSLARSLDRVKLASKTRPPSADAVPRGVKALFSCAAEQQSYEHPELGHGVFFHHVIQGWKGAAKPGEAVSLDDLVRYVRIETRVYAREKLAVVQTPVDRGEFPDAEGWELVAATGNRPAPVAPATPLVNKTTPPPSAPVTAKKEPISPKGPTAPSKDNPPGKPLPAPPAAPKPIRPRPAVTSEVFAAFTEMLKPVTGQKSPTRLGLWIGDVLNTTDLDHIRGLGELRATHNVEIVSMFGGSIAMVQTINSAANKVGQKFTTSTSWKNLANDNVVDGVVMVGVQHQPNLIVLAQTGVKERIATPNAALEYMLSVYTQAGKDVFVLTTADDWTWTPSDAIKAAANRSRRIVWKQQSGESLFDKGQLNVSESTPASTRTDAVGFLNSVRTRAVGLRDINAVSVPVKK